jgi:hypothetical protein
LYFFYVRTYVRYVSYVDHWPASQLSAAGSVYNQLAARPFPDKAPSGAEEEGGAGGGSREGRDMAKKTYDLLFKLLLIGDSGVGKTCILFRSVKYIE